MPQQVINGVGRVRVRKAASSQSSSYDTDAQAFITATAITDTTQKNAINDLVLDLKAAGVWTKMKALYPMVGGTATTHKFNLKDPRDLDAAYRLVFNGGWTHSSTGALPNGTTGYADTKLVPSINLSNLNTHLSYYSRTNITSDVYTMTSTDPNNQLALYANYLGTMYSTMYSGFNGRVTGAVSRGDGFFMGSRTSSISHKIYHNTTLVNTSTTSTSLGSLPNVNMLIGGLNVNLTDSKKECAFASIGDGLTDLESNLFYQIVEKYQYALGRNVNANQTFYFNRNYSNETNAFIFNGAISDATQQSAINTLVNDLKAAGIWTKMKALYPMVGGTATAHKFNLVNPVDTDAAYRLVFYGGWTHSSTGALPNGSNTYANTNLNPSVLPIPLNNIHISFYSRTNVTPAPSTDIGCWTSPSINYTLLAIGTTLGSYAGLQQTSFTDYPVFADSDSRGFYIGARTASNLASIYKNGALKDTSAQASTGNGNNTFYIGSGNGNNPNYSTKQCAFSSIGDGLTDLESNLFYQIVEKFQYTLGRNINASKSFYYDSAYSNETNAFIFNGEISNATQISAVNTLVNDLKAAGIWTKMKALYPMVGGTATSHKFNLVNPVDATSAYALTFNGGWTHTTNGATPNGTTGYANTNLIPSTTLSLNNTHLSFYSRTNNPASEIADIGSLGSNNNWTLIEIYQNLFYNLINQSVSTSNSSMTNSTGMFIGSRTANNILKSYKNNSLLQSHNTISNQMSNISLTIGAMNRSTTPIYYSSRQYAFASIGDGLTDLESNLFYQIVEKFQYTLGRNINTSQPFYYNSSYTNETNAFIFNGAVTDATQISAVNTLVTTLKTAGIWTKMKAVYPMVGGTATAHKFNLVNPIDAASVYALTFNGGWTHSSTGALPNGSNAWANTNLNSSTVLSLNNTHISYYSRTNTNPAAACEVGAGTTDTQGTYLLVRNNNLTYIKVNSGVVTASGYSDTDSLGLYLASRLTSTNQIAYKNGVLKLNSASASNSLSNLNLSLASYNRNGSQVYYSTKECAFASIGDGLTDAEATTFYNAVQAFQTTLGRQV